MAKKKRVRVNTSTKKFFQFLFTPTKHLTMQPIKIPRKYGLKKDKHHFEHPRHVFAVEHAAKLPPSVDLTAKMPPVYDQGQLGSCSANGLGCAFEYDQMNNKSASHAKPFMPSRLFLYYNERAMEGTISEDSGAAIEDGVKALQEKGICPETMWPYDIKEFTKCPPAAAYAAAYHNKLLTFKEIQQSVLQIKTALAQGYPIVFGIQVYESFESDAVATTGMVPMPQPDEQCVGGHCIMIVAFNDSTQLFKFRNSWSASWAENGYGYLPYQYVLDPDLASSFWVLMKVQ